MARWFRFYADAMRNPKVASLNDQQFRLWTELLSVAAENDGHIPPEQTLKHVLKRRLDHLSRGLKELIRAGLIDALKDGYTPHDWDKRQYISDSSTERSRKWRQKRNVAATAPDTDTDTDTDNPLTPLQGEAFTCADFVESWNSVANDCGLPTIRKLTDRRKRAFKVRQNEYPDIDDWKQAFRTLRDSRWMHGDNQNGWRADPDFFLQAKSFTKLVEGAYAKADR